MVCIRRECEEINGQGCCAGAALPNTGEGARLLHGSREVPRRFRALRENTQMPTDSRQTIRTTGKRLRDALSQLLKSEQGPRAVTTAILLIVMILTINGLNVINSYVGRDFMSAIENRDLHAFHQQALIYASIFVMSAIAAAFYSFMEGKLGILWRQQLTWRLTEAYLSEHTYYRLNSATNGVANPDQRITEDVRAFTTTTISFVLLFLNGTVTALSFSGVLWSISPRLFLVAVLYAVVGSLLTIYLGRPLIGLNYNQLDMEANFRADLIHVRENSETIALAHREGRFKTRLQGRLNALTQNFHHLIRVNRNLGFFTNGYNYFIQLIPPLLIAPMFIAGNIEFGVITQSTMAFATLLGAFSLIVTQFQSISAFTAVTTRLQTLSDAIHQWRETKLCAIATEESPNFVRYENVTIRTADESQILIEDLNVEILRGASMLCTGDDDAPKVALFRATAGIWGCASGKILRPSLDDILFLPERPYLPPGTLRHILLRSGMESVTKDDEIQAVLRQLDLDKTVARIGGMDASVDWDSSLSISEMHLLSIARIFLARPTFAFLDRPESSVPKPQVSRILDELTANGIGTVVFSQGNGFQHKFDSELEIMTGGKWVLRPQAGSVRHLNDPDLKDLSC